MKKLALSFVMILLALSSASTVAFGQSAAATPKSNYGFVFSNLGVGGGLTQTMQAIPLATGISKTIFAQVELSMWNGQNWVDVAPPEPEWGHSSVTGVTLGAGQRPLSFTVPDPNGLYQLKLEYNEAGTPFTLIKPWYPNGLQLPSFQLKSVFDMASHLAIGPAEKLTVTSVPQKTVTLLAGNDLPMGADFIVYDSNGNGELVGAQKGAYKLDINGVNCDSAVTLSFGIVSPAQAVPVFVGVRANGMQVDQVLIMPYVLGFSPQCQ